MGAEDSPRPGPVGEVDQKLGKQVREFYGLLFGKNDCLFLISYANYRLIPLTLEDASRTK